MSPLRNFIISTIEHYYNKSELKLDEKSEDALADFINNPHILIIQGRLSNDVIYLHTKGNDLYSNKLQKNLSDLESNLRILAHGKGDTNINVVLSIQDELEFWRTVGQKRDASKKEKEASFNFCELFEDVLEEIRTIHSSSMEEIRESAENIGGILDDIWRISTSPYSQDRMIHVFDIIGHEICSIIQKSVSTTDLWKVHNANKDSEILNLLSESCHVIQTWNSACESLTETYWPNYALHAWNGDPYVPSFCVNFQTRIKEIHDIRSTHNQLNKLLSNNERSELQTNQLFAPFENVNIWMCNGPNPGWETAVSKFSTSLRPAESKVAEKLKPRLHNMSTKQMLYEFMRYSALIERPLVKHALNTELEIFVSSLLSMLKSIQAQMDADEVLVNWHQPPEMSNVVLQIQWAKLMEAKVKEIQICAEKYLKEFDGSSELHSLATKVLKDLKNMYTQLHEEWCRDLQAQAKNGALQISTDKPVVEFSSTSRLMVVNFNPGLVRAELEARALAAMRLPPPPAAAVLDTLSTALAHARPLQQVASFHNTLGERMIPSTRPMMLQAALDLSNLVQDQKAVYWDDVEQLSNYTEKLKKIVLKLETQNTYLTGQHVAIRNIVQKLIETELLAKQSEWKKGVKDIRDIIDTVESNGYKNTELWRSHWDWQLYKALEYQYIKTLLSLHKHFPHVKVDLVLRGYAVRVQPAIEEIRVQHYHQLRRLVSMPAHFVGVQNNLTDKQSIFAAIVEKHSWLGNKAVRQLESALSSLEATCTSWTRRAALACVPDLDALCREHLTQPQHWENNFKACKAYGQAVAKMTFEDEKIEWISVGTTTLRREFEAQARSLWACLMTSLVASCRSDAARIDAFVASAAVMLENQALPKNAKELAEMSATQQALQQQMPEMEQTVEALKRKGHMLRTWGGDTSVDGTMKEWQKIHELMLSQQKMFEHQAELVKSSLSGEWDNLNTSIEAWTSRWTQAKPRLDDTHGVNYAEMLDRCRSVFEAQANWNKFVSERDDLLKECEKFHMKVQLSDTWDQADKLMAEYVELWSPFKEYNEEFDSIADQEWIVFQKKIHLIEEFSVKWKAHLEPFTVLTLYIQQELEKYSDLAPLLKYLRGNEFTERHWREVYSLLDMEYKKPDTLQVRDLLNVAVNIKKQIKSLQKICTSASSESAIRNALNELEIWFASARFNITYYNDKAKRPTPIVKDFKDILSKIEEQQWVVSSLSGGANGTDACGAWDARLRAARALLRATHHAQRRWLYLEPILSNDDGELGIKFRKVDQGFRQVTRILEADPRLSALLQSSRLQPMLDSISEQLLACQSALNVYIDEKRSVFPRLYFLSDDDLLELLGQARAGAEGREAVMQTHLKKLFPGITGVRLGPGDMSITALCTHYGETFQLDHPVDIDCPVEIWLKNLEAEMRSSLKSMTLKCIVTNSLQEQDPFSLPTQILCLAQNIRFTEQAEKAITSKELHKLKANIEKENLYYASAEIEDESERRKRQALILQCAHYLSVIRILIDSNIVSTSDWLWQKQLRFYVLNTNEVVAKMGLAQISYSYEYLGVNTGQFVRTELADDCFFILTQSLHLGLVGNPFGPAGTGKTESVKALGGLVGRLVLIFNCDEAMDAQCMGRLLSGLALCGAWGCFDEFNRLAAHTLAAVSHQLSSLLSATTDKTPGSEPTAVLNGKHVRVSEWCGVAATMNPAGRGYGGRRTLPAALQRVLRPVAMLQPRPDVLAAHLLAAACVPDAEILAKDLHNVFSLASSLLSEQRHYDWGLRALKAAVGSCAAALQARAGDGRRRRALTRRLLTLNNLSKLTTYDAKRFENILSLVFADVPTEESSSDPICSALEATVDNLKLVHNKLQLQKCVELYEQMQQRMGVVIVGPPGSGKTTIRRLLKSALAHQGKNVVEYIICPKAMSREWLLGNIDHDTRQWTDGVISSTALEISNQPSDVWSWVVCDGDIDPEWIEALNSVLDDNRLLTLPSGWRIQFGSNVNFLFETHSLEHASPATVSRMGIILLSDDVSCELDVLEGWMHSADFDNENAKMALPLLQQVIKKSIQWLSDHKSDLALKLQNVTVVKQILTQFEYVAQDTGFNTTRVSPEELVYLVIERSVVDIIKDSAIDSFHDELSSVMGPPIVAPVCTNEWVSDTLLMSRRLVACEPTLRACVTSHTAHLLLVGPEACAKNLLAEYIIKECNSAILTIDCTPILEPADIIAELKRNNMVRSGGRGVSGGARGTLLIRSLHRARTDAWKSSPVHSFLLQLIQHNGFWSRGTDEEGGAGTQWCQVARLRVLATATTHTAISPRLAAALELRVLSESDDEELLEIAAHYLKNSVDKSIPMKDISKLSEKLLAMFKEVTETFDSEIHYKWNASHLKRWCENIKWYSPMNVDQLVMAISAEANFIFRERLISDDEKAMFSTISRKHLKVNNEAMYFACKLRGDGVFLEQTDYNDWHRRTELLINQCLSENEHNVFGETGAEVCSELAVLCPAMARSTNGGLLVCVGCAGVGRLAAAHITAAALPATLFVINDDTQFNTIFKNALSSAGEGKRSVVLVRESAATRAALAAVEALRRARTAHALPALLLPNAENNALKSIKENLGIVICLDKSQENLSELMDTYPLLYNDGNVVWLDRWCDVTLRETPRLIVQRLLKENAVESTKEQLDALPIDGFVNIHKSIDVEWKRAPCRYVNFVKTYYNISNRKKAALVQRHTMLSAGVEALRRARTDVSRLQAEAAKQELALREKQAAAAHALQQISATVRANTDHKDEMHTLKRNIEIENEKLQAQKKEIEAELAAVEPIITAARSAVGDIRPESLSEVRSLRAPPEVVRDVLEGVLRLMGIADTSWHSMKNFLSKRGVKEDIRCMDASQISPAAISSVQRLLESRGASFEPGTARRASAACAPLAAWVKANLHYAAALQRVQPLQAHQAKLHKLLKENAVESTKEQLDALPIDGFVNIHKSIDVEWKRAPCRYVNFVKTYYNISNRKKAALVQRHTMLSAGVEALRRARTDVSRLQAEAAKQELALREKQAAAAHALQQISATVRANTDHKDEMHTLKRNIEIENEKLQAQKKEIEAELAAVEPIITAARSAVGDIRPESLSEVRSLRAPPEVVRDVLEGVLRLMGIADTSWHSMKNFLSKRGVKEDIRCMDASQISPAAISSVQRLLESRGASFEPGTARRASAACAPLAAWVKANLHYAAALQRVQPLQAHQAKLHKNLTDAEQQMAALSTGLATVEERVAALQEQLGQHTRDAAALELRLTHANDTITAATSLIDQLAHEYTAWESDLENISKEISQLNPRSLLSAAYIVYLPDITEPQARAYVTKWSALIGFEDSSFSIINFLSSTEKQLKWEADGLPSDTTAIKNAVLIDQFLESQRCGFTPLIVDPDGEGLAWLKNTLAGTQCDFVSQRSEKFMTTVQYAVRLGRTLVISEASDAPQYSGARVLLQCAAAPALPPHRAAALSPLYFTPTLHALTDQLVHYALQQQNPEVDEKSREIKLKKATLQKQQYELQENLLRELSNKGDILQDAGVLASLSKTRATNDTIVEALTAAKEVEQASRVACQMYEPAALRTAILALATNGLAARWPLIALPVDAVLDIFVDAVRRQPDQTKINNNEVVKCVTRKIVERVLLSLHKKDKYVVILYLLKQVYDDMIPNEMLVRLSKSMVSNTQTAKLEKHGHASYASQLQRCFMEMWSSMGGASH
uniref:Dynein heavy chain, cytoplasmic n=1 Tax=Heliothis virescens TaxID=7102 RepID=A0A2A4JRE1_HELVI